MRVWGRMLLSNSLASPNCRIPLQQLVLALWTTGTSEISTDPSLALLREGSGLDVGAVCGRNRWGNQVLQMWAGRKKAVASWRWLNTLSTEKHPWGIPRACLLSAEGVAVKQDYAQKLLLCNQIVDASRQDPWGVESIHQQEGRVAFE